MIVFKKAILIPLLFLFQSSFGQDHIDSLWIVPPNTNSSDSVKIIAETHFPTYPCHLDSSKITVNNGQINVRSYYYVGNQTMPCSSIDTVLIGVLDTGNYELIYHAINSYWNYNGTDTLYFSVDAATSITSKGKQTSELSVYPNPVKNAIELKVQDEMKITSIELFSMKGRLIKEYNGSGLTLDVSGVKGGVFFLRVKGEKETVVKKVVVE